MDSAILLPGKLKKCTKCLEWKSLNIFNFKDKSRGTRQRICKDCVSIVSKGYSKTRDYSNTKLRQDRIKYENRLKIFEYLNSHPCVDCGNDDWRLLEFDHIADDKEFSITQKMTLNWTKLELEISKCVIRCANCHSLITQQRKNSWRIWWTVETEKPRLILSNSLKDQKKIRQDQAIILLSEGKSYEEVVKSIGIGYSTISKWLRDPEFKKRMPEDFEYVSVKKRKDHITHCIHGHEFTEENTRLITRKDGKQYRNCKICARIRKKENGKRMRSI